MAKTDDLTHNKSDFQHALKNAPTHEHPALAAKHGWHIVDLVCEAEVSGLTHAKCGNKVSDHVVDTRSTIADDLRVKPCFKCGARGQWTHAKAVKPAAPKVTAPEVTEPEAETTADA